MSLSVGDTAPPFVAQEVKSGVPISLYDYLHQTVVLAFNGLSWCPPCQFEAPILEELWQLYGPGVQFIMISENDPEEELLNAMQVFGITMPVVRDVGQEIAKDYIFDAGGWAVPEVFVLRPSPSAPPPLHVPADHFVVCSRKRGAGPPEAELKAELAARLDGCIPEGLETLYWEEFNPLKWIDPGPLRFMTPEKRDVLISLGLSELARSLSDPVASRQLERRATEAMFAAARAARNKMRTRKAIDLKGQSIVRGRAEG